MGILTLQDVKAIFICLYAEKSAFCLKQYGVTKGAVLIESTGVIGHRIKKVHIWITPLSRFRESCGCLHVQSTKGDPIMG